ncbi:MAG: hypothetical protein HOK97_17645 [Deltaproteobacteria bacterium]|nr:hypothetical protein [Deltaproteobacteria bacterium]MBT6491598.1 hypothetical protein [Deltaproteobacteria bacterium]
MSSKIYKFSVLILSFVGIVLISACGNPCLTLAKDVCKCEPTETLQRSCISALTDDSDEGPSQEQQNVCSDLLSTTCTGDDLCERLAQGDLAACGLSQID